MSEDAISRLILTKVYELCGLIITTLVGPKILSLRGIQPMVPVIRVRRGLSASIYALDPKNAIIAATCEKIFIMSQLRC